MAQNVKIMQRRDKFHVRYSADISQSYSKQRDDMTLNPYTHAILSYFGTCLMCLTLQPDKVRMSQVW